MSEEYKIVSSGLRGSITNIDYTVPSSRNVATVLSGIEEYVNKKTMQMKKTKGLKKSKISVAIKFTNGKYISTTYNKAGLPIDVTSVYDEYGGDATGYGRVAGFSILFY